MLFDTSPDNGPEFYRHGISDKLCDVRGDDLFIRGDEFIVRGECLENSRLSKTYRSILFWVAKTAIAETDALRGHGWSGLVPSHTSVNGTAVRFPRFLFMTIQNEIFIKRNRGKRTAVPF